MVSKESTYFVSGHRNLTNEEFNFFYVPIIEEAIANTTDIHFVVGDYYGADIMFQNYMAEHHIDLLPNINVYHMFESPRNVNPLIPKENYVGGFQTDIERDSAMTQASQHDIAFIHKSRWTSGTAQNILRRHEI